MAVKDVVEGAISENKIVVFAKSWCTYCKQVKVLLKEAYPDTPAVVYDLDEREDGSAIQSYLHEKSGQRTVPNVYINQKHVGGCDATRAMLKNAKISV